MVVVSGGCAIFVFEYFSFAVCMPQSVAFVVAAEVPNQLQLHLCCGTSMCLFIVTAHSTKFVPYSHE